MLTPPSVLVQPAIAQASTPAAKVGLENPWMASSGLLLLLLLGLGCYSQVQHARTQKRLKFEEFKNKELQKKVQRALQTITRMEKNPDLIHSREFNLDYLRMRMEEDQFQFSIVNQVKIKVKQKISVALRPQQAEAGLIGVASQPRAVDEIFDVEYALNDQPGARKRVLFRIQIRLAKLPAQATSATIGQLIQCVEAFLGPTAERSSWQPTIQGRIAYMHWDQKAKPTPLLVIEQSSDGVNVTLRSKNRLQAAS
jgi:hypothetical protein